LDTKKHGKYRGIQRYKCLKCNKTFSSKRRPIKLQKTIFNDYFNHRYTLQELSIKYNHSREWIQSQIHSFKPDIYTREGRDITAVIDATFFGKKVDKFGLIVVKDVKAKEAVAYNFIETETKEVYKDILSQLEFNGFKLKAVTLDGKPGIMKFFENIPVQMCHFHMKQIITRKLTRNPKLDASKKLKWISSKLDLVSECRFRYLLDAWHSRFEDFIDEKVQDESKRGWHYKHRNVRSAYRSLKRFLPYLFTYQKYPELNIPNTTNLLDGGCFSPLKDKLKVHRGTSKKMKMKMIVFFLENKGK